jgi:hypothetical protein
MKLLAYSVEIQGKQLLFKCSDGNTLLTDKWFDACSFLLESCDMAVCWSVDHFAEAFISLLPKSKANELLEDGRTYLDNGEKIYYQVGRVFAITYGRETNIYPLKKYGDKEITDVNELEKLGYNVLEAYKLLGIEPTRLTSPVSCFSLDTIDYPRACDLPESSLPLLNMCSEKVWVEWREVFKLGHWQANEVQDFDLSAAYPSLMARLPDIRGAKFFESDIMPEQEDYSWGDMIGDLTLNEDVTPYGFIGTQEFQITTEDLWLIRKYQWGEFKLKHGCFFKLPKYYKLPFKDTMQGLYDARSNQNLMVKIIVKAISVGIGGKLVQRYQDGKLGLDNNAIYGRMITSRCSIKVADMIWRNGLQKSTISILVDGFLAENNGIKIDLGSGGMGSWRVNEPSPFLVASLLYQWGAEKHPDGNMYDKVLEEIKKNSRSPIIGDGVDLNLLQHDRIFRELPKTGGDLLNKRYNSLPIEKH